MNEFTASNGVQIILASSGKVGCVLEGPADEPTSGFLGSREMIAWREFFQHERDEELGRWRWAEHPGYVVKPRSDGWMVLHEPTNHTKLFVGSTDAGSAGNMMAAAALAYFAAHPEPKPWENAKPGEVWVFTAFHGVEIATMTSAGFPFRTVFHTVSGAEFNTENMHLTGARRIWPEEAA